MITIRVAVSKILILDLALLFVFPDLFSLLFLLMPLETNSITVLAKKIKKYSQLNSLKNIKIKTSASNFDVTLTENFSPSLSVSCLVSFK